MTGLTARALSRLKSTQPQFSTLTVKLTPLKTVYLCFHRLNFRQPDTKKGPVIHKNCAKVRAKKGNRHLLHSTRHLRHTYPSFTPLCTRHLRPTLKKGTREKGKERKYRFSKAALYFFAFCFQWFGANVKSDATKVRYNMPILFGKLNRKVFESDNYHVYNLVVHGGDRYTATYQGDNPPKALKTAQYQITYEFFKHPKYGKQVRIYDYKRSSVTNKPTNYGETSIVRQAQKAIG